MRNVSETIKRHFPVYKANWFQNSKQLEKIFEENSIKNVLELGSYTGAGSTKYFGEKIEGKLHCVDEWEDSEYFEENKQGDYTKYEIFLSNIYNFGLSEIVYPIKMKTEYFWENYNEIMKDIKIDLIYIDASHDYEDVKNDIEMSLIHLPNCIICGDDWKWESVREAVEDSANENDLNVEIDFNFWRLTKILQ